MRPWLILLAFAVLAAGVWWGSKHPKGETELSQAPMWASLQSIESTHRGDKSLATPLFMKGAVDEGRYDVVGLHSDSARFPYVWIVLNTNAGKNGIHALPHDVDFNLACSEVDALAAKTMLDAAVAAALRAHCKE